MNSEWHVRVDCNGTSSSRTTTPSYRNMNGDKVMYIFHPDMLVDNTSECRSMSAKHRLWSQPQTPHKVRAARRKVGTHTSSSAHTYKSHAHVFDGHDGATALACVGNDDRRLRAAAGSIPNEQPTAKSVDYGNFTTANFTQNSLKAPADWYWGRSSSSSASDCAIPVAYWSGSHSGALCMIHSSYWCHLEWLLKRLWKGLSAIIAA